MYYPANAARRIAVANYAYASGAILTPGLVGRLGEAVRAYAVQAALPAAKRSRTGLFVRGASRAEGRAIAALFGDRLALPIARIDAKAIEGVCEDTALRAIGPLVSRTARVVLVESLRDGSDARLCDGLVWSSNNVLLVGCSALGEDSVDERLRGAFDFMVDCRVKTRVSADFFAALGV